MIEMSFEQLEWLSSKRETTISQPINKTPEGIQEKNIKNLKAGYFCLRKKEESESL